MLSSALLFGMVLAGLFHRKTSLTPRFMRVSVEGPLNFEAAFGMLKPGFPQRR